MSGPLALLLIMLVVFAMWTALASSLLFSALALAAASMSLTLIMYLLGARLAAVFELSVCAGLITAIFVSVISLTRAQGAEEERLLRAGRMRRFIWLPPLLAAVAAVWYWWAPAIEIAAVIGAAPEGDVREILWHERRFDLLGQMLIILSGVFGVIVLFKDSRQNQERR